MRATETNTEREEGGKRREVRGTRQSSQEVKKDTAVIFPDIPPGVKVWNWKHGGEVSRTGRLPGPHCSQLSAKAVSAVGVPVGGKGGILCQVGRGLLYEIPALPSSAKNSS